MIEHNDEWASFEKYKSLEYEEMCKIKQGYVAEVIEQKGRMLDARPVFAVLNEKTIALFENENVNALIKTVEIKKLDIPVIPLPWSKFNCIQLKEKDPGDSD